MSLAHAKRAHSQRLQPYGYKDLPVLILRRRCLASFRIIQNVFWTFRPTYSWNSSWKVSALPLQSCWQHWQETVPFFASTHQPWPSSPQRAWNVPVQPLSWWCSCCISMLLSWPCQYQAVSLVRMLWVRGAVGRTCCWVQKLLGTGPEHYAPLTEC